MIENSFEMDQIMGDPIEFMYFYEVEAQGFRNEAERDFLTALFAHASEWAQLGVKEEDCYINYWDKTLMVGFHICDWKQSQVLRTLQIDFTGTAMLMGETDNLFGCKFNSNSPRVKSYLEDKALSVDFANVAAKWLLQELNRPIRLKEWITSSYHHKQYEMVDTNQPIGWSDSENKERKWLGSPTRVAIVHPLNNQIPWTR